MPTPNDRDGKWTDLVHEQLREAGVQKDLARRARGISADHLVSRYYDGKDASHRAASLRDLLHLVVLTCTSHTSLAAENLFLRKQLAFYVERTSDLAAGQRCQSIAAELLLKLGVSVSASAISSARSPSTSSATIASAIIRASSMN